ncbi:hypothetical protein, partial [Enterococcus faecalis]|uniref:hypothetical protein n=1 Tax=Enterococcus faecalis TaxID=1351 RepID=UPI00403F8F77
RALLLQRVAQRTSTVQALGDNLPLEQAFALRAADIMKSLFSADGVLLEGVIGHARLAHAEDASAPEEIERWATVYARFYLAGLATIPL